MYQTIFRLDLSLSFIKFIFSFLGLPPGIGYKMNNEKR